MNTSAGRDERATLLSARIAVDIALFLDRQAPEFWKLFPGDSPGSLQNRLESIIKADVKRWLADNNL